MDITFMIGNGFDVDKGIESSYAKFYEWYCDQSSNIKHIEAFRKPLKMILKAISLMTKRHGQILNTASENI